MEDSIDFIDSLIQLDFSEDSKSSGYKYNKKQGWLGCTTNHPDVIFENKDFVVRISLQGVLCPEPESESEMELFKNMAVRYIGVYKKPFMGKYNNCIYKTFSGILPKISIIQ